MDQFIIKLFKLNTYIFQQGLFHKIQEKLLKYYYSIVGT